MRPMIACLIGTTTFVQSNFLRLCNENKWLYVTSRNISTLSNLGKSKHVSCPTSVVLPTSFQLILTNVTILQEDCQDRALHRNFFNVLQDAIFCPLFETSCSICQFWPFFWKLQVIS
jgi:hypothetical protein